MTNAYASMHGRSLASMLDVSVTGTVDRLRAAWTKYATHRKTLAELRDLLTRALTGSLAAAVLAGVVAAFNEYRLVWEVAHLQTLSIYWFPFVLYGVERYLTTGRRRGLVLAAVSWSALNLSSVYYLAYCAPFIV